MAFPEISANPRTRALLATLLFLISWFLGNGALTAQFEYDAGVFSLGLFAIACIIWWLSFRISRSANGKGATLGFIALGMWTLGLILAFVIGFHQYIRDPVCWGFTAMLLLLVVGVSYSDRVPDRRKIPSTPNSSGAD